VVSLLGSKLEELLRVLEEVILLSLDFLLDLSKKALGLFEFSLTKFVSRLKVFLGRLFLSKSLFSSIVLLFGGIESLHFLFKSHVDRRDINTLVGQVLCIRTQLVSFGGNFGLEIFLLFFALGTLLTIFAEL
jgi:hypothetical protein